MSSDAVTHTEELHNVDEEAYEPTYAEAFPPLPMATATDREATAAAPAPQWNKLSMRTSTITQVFSVPLEERKFNENKDTSTFGEGEQQAKICSEIMADTGVSIELSSGKDRSLTVVLTGKGEAVQQARKQITARLQTQQKKELRIPKDHHRFLLGPKGQNLNKLELLTSTRIMLPAQKENSDIVTIIGAKDGIERACHEIQVISDEQAKLGFERLNIEREYHPFIAGPHNKNSQTMAEQFKVRINIPPIIALKDEVVVAGDKDGVVAAVGQIMRLYNEKKKKCQTVSVEVRKSQHKYVIGPKGSNLHDILAETGVSVEVPPQDVPSETITLRGEQDKLGPALTMVYSKANSIVIAEVEAPVWLHRFIIGRKGANINKITQDHPKVHIEFSDGQNKIELEGPPEEVEAAQEALSKITTDLKKRMSFAEIQVDQKYHKHIIGKNGVNVTRIKEDTGVSIRIPPDNENSNTIRIEGSPEGVATAKQELMQMVQKMENEKSRDIIIEQRFHKTLIGAQGASIKEIRDKFNQVQITFPDAIRKSDVVTLRGPKADVDKCYHYLKIKHQELIAKNYKAEVHIFKKFHKNIIGKHGANIKKIRDETDTKIDLPSEDSDSDVIVITGKKEKVEEAKEMIEVIQKQLANIMEVTIEIPHKFHNSIIGAKGRLIKSVMEECGGVLIRFPPEGSNSDKVTIRGPKEDVEKAKKLLLELAHEKKESGFTAELKAKPEYHKFLIGKRGDKVRKLREQTGARVIFPSQDDQDQDVISIIGKKECVLMAKKELEEVIGNLEKSVEMQISVDPKHHRHFVVKRGEVLRTIVADFGNVEVSFPRSGQKSDQVTLKGPKECVEGVKDRILEIVTDLDAQVTIECVIPQKHHRTVMGPKGIKVQEITKDFDVGIKFPDRPTDAALQERAKMLNGDATNGNADALQLKWDTIIITGKQENCDGAKEALLNLVPITKEVAVPLEYHKFIIGQKGHDVQAMMKTHEVIISIPPATEETEFIKIVGAPSNVAEAEKEVLEKIKKLDGEKEDRAARSFKLEVQVDPKYHPKIIGRKGAVITQIRKENDVQIQFPDRGGEREDIIVITGLENLAIAAKEHILKIVRELEDRITEEVKIDSRIHSRIIGARGRAVRKIMDTFKVDIKFPSPSDADPDIVQIIGGEDNVLDCKDHLQNLEEKFMQDVNEQEALNKYLHPPTKQEEQAEKRGDGKGFVVREAPWSGKGNAPDTNSTDDFPEFGATVGKPSPPIAWGPRRK